MARLRTFSVWLTVIVTGLSIITYVGRARSFLLSKAGLGGDSTFSGASKEG